jgi:hypothetical protein
MFTLHRQTQTQIHVHKNPCTYECMYVQVYVRTCTSTYTCAYTFMKCTWRPGEMYVHTSTCMSWMNVHTHTYTCTCTYLHVRHLITRLLYVYTIHCMYIYVYVNLHASCTYTYAYLHEVHVYVHIFIKGMCWRGAIACRYTQICIHIVQMHTFMKCMYMYISL